MLGESPYTVYIYITIFAVAQMHSCISCDEKRI